MLIAAGVMVCGFEMKNPNPLRWSALLALLLGMTACLLWRGAPLTRSPLIWAVSAFVAYAAATLLWSPDWREGSLRLQSIVLLAALFLFLAHADRALLKRMVPLVASFALVYGLGIEWYFTKPFGGLGNENFQAEWLLIIAPLCLMGNRDTPTGAFCFLAGCTALVWGIGFNGSNARLAALAAMIITYMLYCGFYRLALVALVSGLVALWHWGDLLLLSFANRAEIAYNTILMWFDFPLFGVGLGGYGGLLFGKGIRAAHRQTGKTRGVDTVFFQNGGQFGVHGTKRSA